MAKVIIAAFLVLVLISPAAYAATTHNVGGPGGWNTGVDYDSWASGRTFTIGDNLAFTYDSSHAVAEVNQADYQNCNTGSPIKSYTSSPTSISLTKTGTRYFICPRSNHCATGMKVAVTVVAAGGSSPPGGSGPPSGGSSPSPPSDTPGTPPSTNTPSPPRPPAGNGATSHRNSLMVGLSLVLGAVLGVMG